MILSIVTGTYNRLKHLQAMVASARANIPRGIAHEFVIVDGGSDDGTLNWCRQQPDVTLIEHGALHGAIRAFCDGAQAAQGEYVLLANDDVTFEPDSIVAALAYLETHASCGAVAFADNRPAPGYEQRIWKVQTMQAREGERPVHVVYAQVGLFRKWLGDLVGWWGAEDTEFGGATYGGDNYLSARIWELGYTVDSIEIARCRDNVVADSLREHNHQIEQSRPGRYYHRYPEGPLLADSPRLPNEQQERLRVLYLPIYERYADKQQVGKRGLREALARMGLVYEIDYVNAPYDLARAVSTFQPHLLLMQCHAANSVPLEHLVAARRARPAMVVVNWNGDVYHEELLNEAMLAYLRHVDLQLTVNASVIEAYAQRGILAAYWQVAFEPVDYEALPDVPVHDVVFLANCYSDMRRAIGEAIRGLPGVNVGLYGRGWKWAMGDTTYDFPAGAALYRNAKIAIGDNQYAGETGFVSNRIFEALASGAFLLHQRVNGLEALTGLQEDVHYVVWEDVADLTAKIRHWLKPRYVQKRAEIAQAGQQFVREKHNFDARVQELIYELLPRIEGVEA